MSSVKRKNPQIKKRWLIVPTIITPILIWIIWLFQTSEPSEKFYSVDKQYSYYLSKYNYNKIYELIPFHSWKDEEYKVYLYDEVKQKTLFSRYLGEIYWNDNYGFDYEVGAFFTRNSMFYSEDSKFYFDKGDYYTLPRPIDRNAIEQRQKREEVYRDSVNLVYQEELAIRQEQERERAIHDSICWEQAKEEFYNLPAITQEEIEYIQPEIGIWTEHFNIDLSQAKFLCKSVEYFNSEPFKGTSYREFTNEHDSRSLIGMAYSPDKQRYIDIGIRYKTIDGKRYDNSHALSNINLVDRKEKHQNQLLNAGFCGTLRRAHDVFWKNNNVFIIVGANKSYQAFCTPCMESIRNLEITLGEYVIYVFDISNNTIKLYGLLTDDNIYTKFDSYREMHLKEKGILPKKAIKK